MKLYILMAGMVLAGAVVAGSQKQVLLVAGKSSHGQGEHEYPAGADLLAKALNDSGLPIRASVCAEKWPAAGQLDAADSLVLYCDGNDDHLAIGHEGDLLKVSNAGTGLVVLHYALDGTEGLLDETLMKVVGGCYHDTESANPLWTVKDPFFAAGHPITRGLKPYELKDEWYFNLRFGDVFPVMMAKPPMEEKVHTLAWTFGDNAFGFTGGHFHSSWGEPNFRKMVLNAIVWSAGLTVPDAGVESVDPILVKNKTILHAIAKGDPVDVRNHVLLGADVNQKNNQGWTPLHFATVRGKTACAEVLVAKGAALDERTGTLKTPLHLAADRGYLEIVRLLVDSGADLNARDDEGWTPLHYAAEKDRVDVAAYLVEQGAEVNAISQRGGTPLIEASASASPEMVHLLLDFGADQSIAATNGMTALDYALELGNEAAEQILK
ncbi:ankyrin repeat domain-containing protein [Pontiella agarivorans]|uniref:Ankyrin repeat domain-containing protein n=1 Tax=Pontiella agarivorans TaxID=3038953 RepID=A0ABU5MUP3_9BACT|nr:ankyrin repeat domain-containing protein [Pontiella agarivorans]MDZ8117939.1 ankyrin repeat domain-containing protein [Pontiella agarivorans]